MPHLDTGNTAFMLLCASLVMLMTPGLAFFYAGMVRSKNVLGMLMQNFFCIGIVTLLWTLVGYSIANTQAMGNAFRMVLNVSLSAELLAMIMSPD